MPSSVVYVGIRGPQPGYGHGGPRVVGVIRNGEKRTLTLADERYLHQESFEWGYDGAGPALLATAILNDYLGIEVDQLDPPAVHHLVLLRRRHGNGPSEMIRDPQAHMAGIIRLQQRPSLVAQRRSEPIG